MEIKNWKMTYEGHKDLPCQVPCSMYSVLLEHGIIEDPLCRAERSAVHPAVG